MRSALSSRIPRTAEISFAVNSPPPPPLSTWSRDWKRYRQALKVLEGHVRNGRAEYFHIVAESWPDGTARVRWNEYARDEREEAIRAFEEVEAAIEHFPGAETVLVRVASVDALRTAYPSYFADTRAFVAELEKAIA